MPQYARSQRAAPVEEDGIVVPSTVEFVPLDEADGIDESAVAAVTDDIEIPDDPADDTFLEEEEEDSTTVVGLIDGEIETDEES